MIYSINNLPATQELLFQTVLLSIKNDGELKKLDLFIISD